MAEAENHEKKNRYIRSAIKFLLKKIGVWNFVIRVLTILVRGYRDPKRFVGELSGHFTYRLIFHPKVPSSVRSVVALCFKGFGEKENSSGSDYDIFLQGRFHFEDVRPDIHPLTKIKIALAKNDQDGLFDLLKSLVEDIPKIEKKKHSVDGKITIGFFCSFIDSDIFRYTINSYNAACDEIEWVACDISTYDNIPKNINCRSFVFSTVEEAVEYSNENFNFVIDADGPLRERNYQSLVSRTSAISINYYNLLSSTFHPAFDAMITIEGVPVNKHQPTERLIEMPAMGAWSLPAKVNSEDIDDQYEYDITFVAEQFKFGQNFLTTFAPLSRRHKILFAGLKAPMYFYRRLQEYGWKVSNVTFVPRLPLDEFIELLQKCRIVLDTLDYSGGSSTLIALRSGTPVMARKGEYLVDSVSAMMLEEMGLNRLIYKEVEDISRFLDHASDEDLAKLRRDVLKATDTSLYFNPDKFLSLLKKNIDKEFGEEKIIDEAVAG